MVLLGYRAGFVSAETYRLRIFDVLEETLLVLATADRESGTGSERAELFQYIQEGVNDFVRFLDPASFYGLVDQATVAALILRAAQVCPLAVVVYVANAEPPFLLSHCSSCCARLLPGCYPHRHRRR